MTMILSVLLLVPHRSIVTMRRLDIRRHLFRQGQRNHRRHLRRIRLRIRRQAMDRTRHPVRHPVRPIADRRPRHRRQTEAETKGRGNVPGL